MTYVDTDQPRSTLRTQLSSGTAPDVFTAWPGTGNPAALTVLRKAGHIADLSSASFASKTAEEWPRRPRARRAGTPNGGHDVRARRPLPRPA